MRQINRQKEEGRTNRVGIYQRVGMTEHNRGTTTEHDKTLSRVQCWVKGLELANRQRATAKGRGS